MLKISNYSAITYNSITLKIVSCSPIKRQKTKKSVVGKTLIQARVIGMNDQQWELNMSGLVLGTTAANLATNRANIEALDSAASYAYVDGIHDGNYYVSPGTLIFEDNQESAGTQQLYRYSITLVQG